VEVEVLGSVDLYVRSRQGVDPYFHLPMSGTSNGWRKVWFFLRNNADAPLPMFMGSCPDSQPLCEVVQQLLHNGLMGLDLLWTFLSHRVQPLRQLGMTMWMYMEPSCPNRPLSEELGDTEINTWIHRVLAHGAVLSLGTSPVPL
jgi:hypothetical protein